MNDGEIDPARLVPILHYDGTPITARFIVKAIGDMLAIMTLAPFERRCRELPKDRGPAACMRAERPRSPKRRS